MTVQGCALAVPGGPWQLTFVFNYYAGHPKFQIYENSVPAFQEQEDANIGDAWVTTRTIWTTSQPWAKSEVVGCEYHDSLRGRRKRGGRWGAKKQEKKFFAWLNSRRKGLRC